MRTMTSGVDHDDVPPHVTESHQDRRATGVAEGRRPVARAPADDASLEDHVAVSAAADEGIDVHPQPVHNNFFKR